MNRQLLINDYIQNPKQMAIPENMTKKEERKWGKINKFMRINLSSTTVHLSSIAGTIGFKSVLQPFITLSPALLLTNLCKAMKLNVKF